MNPYLHQHITSADMTVHALSRDLDRTVLISDAGQVITAREMRDNISRFQQLIEKLCAEHSSLHSAGIETEHLRYVAPSRPHIEPQHSLFDEQMVGNRSR